MTQAVLFAKRAIAWPLCIAIALSILSGRALAQGSAGQISGTIHDEQSGVLPGVSMTVKNQVTGVSRTIVSDESGRYVFAALPSGRYTLRAELSGFGIQEVSDIVITIGLEYRQDLTMKVQALAESVTIRGESPIVDVTRAEISGTVTRQQIETLPLNSRQYLSLALLVAGTALDATRARRSTSLISSMAWYDKHFNGSAKMTN